MISSEWKEVKLGDAAIVTKLAGFEFTKYIKYKESGEVIAIRALNVKNGTFDLTDVKRIDRDISDSLTRSKLYKGDIVLTYTGAKFGEVALVRHNDRYHLAPNVAKVTAGENCDPYFLYSYFRGDYFRQQLNNYSGGSSQPTIPMSAIRQLTVPVPSLIEQKAIAATLSCLDDKIELNSRMNKNLEEMAQAIFKRWFVDFEPFQDSEFEDSELGMIPKGWRVEKLGDVCKCILGGTPSRKNQEYWNGNIPWINSGKVNEFRIIEASEYITDKGLAKSATTLLPIKTTVLAITGATLGQVSLLEISSCANQSVVGILENELLPYEFIYPMICNQIKEIINHQTGGAQQHINKGNVEGEKFILPSQKAISKYKALVSGIYQIIAKNCFENKKLQETRDLLLPKLMSGEIRVPIEEVQ